MIQRFKCGHETTVGFWKDDAWYSVSYDCPKCKAERQLKPGYRTLVVGKKTLVIKRARGGTVDT